MRVRDGDGCGSWDVGGFHWDETEALDGLPDYHVIETKVVGEVRLVRYPGGSSEIARTTDSAKRTLA